ncbi:MAG TPA: hypothetical protein VKT28_14035 [Puia sp.]|nr:hypothetical protein [Puia sp.]
MKKVILITLIAAFSQSGISQSEQDKILSRISNSFSVQFPSAHLKNLKFKNNNYIAEFTVDNKKLFAFYSVDANWLKTETKIKWTWDLPPKVENAFFKSKYGNWAINEIKEIQMPAQHLYSIHVNDGDLLDSNHYDVFIQDVIFYFKPDGGLQKSIMQNE